MSIKQRLSVLVVDDTSVSRGLIVNSLEEIGFKNINATKDGASAFDMIVKQGYQLVISDQNMPGMTGVQLLEKVRTYPPTSKIGFVLVSGTLTQDLVEKAKKAGINNILPKPFDTPKMKNCLQAVLGPL